MNCTEEKDVDTAVAVQAMASRQWTKRATPSCAQWIAYGTHGEDGEPAPGLVAAATNCERGCILVKPRMGEQLALALPLSFWLAT